MRAWLFALCGFALSACSVLVDPESLVIKCEVLPGAESQDPCLAAGMRCINSECRPCKEATEVCNGIDDDCDGVIDNGQDEDGDGFTWCGGLVFALADCAPKDPKIHPAGMPGPDGTFKPAPKEECDGKDNDCDTKVDEARECDMTPSCVDVGCMGAQRCDATSGKCIEPRPVGNGCTNDSECAGGVCAHPADFGLDVSADDARCASACCLDSDCASDSVCVASEHGPRLCLPANIAGRATVAAGGRCSRDDNCVTGACIRTYCVTRCFSEGSCGSDLCTLGTGGPLDPRIWLCDVAQGREPAGTACSTFDPTACRSGYCTTDRNTCAKPCARNSDCGSDELCTAQNVRPLLTPSQTSLISICEPRPIIPPLTPSDVLCCTNADCGAGKLCAPKALDPDFSVMACR